MVRRSAIIAVILGWLMLAAGRHTCRLQAAEGTIAGAAPVVGNAVGSDAVDPRVAQLMKQWSAERESIASAHIQYRFYGGTFDPPTYPADQVGALLDQYDLAGDPQAFIEILAVLLEGTEQSLADYSDPPWFVGEYYQLGDQRLDVRPNGWRHLIDAHEEYLTQPHPEHRQLTVFSRGGSALQTPKIGLFLHDPSLRPVPLQNYRIRNKETSDGRMEIEIAPDPGQSLASWLEVDETTGHLIRDVHCVNGAVHQEWRQLGMTEYDGGGVLPAVSLWFRYQEGRVAQISYRAVDAAVLNGVVDPNVFTTPVEEGMVVVDTREGEPIVHKSETASNDVVSYLASIATPPPGPPDTRMSFWRWGLILNGIVMVIVSAFLWRRSQHLASERMRNSVDLNPLEVNRLTPSLETIDTHQGDSAKTIS